MERESILQEAQRLIHGPRRENYGHPLDDYTRTAGLFNAAFAHKLKEPLTAEEMMLVMVLVKVSRQVNKSGRDNLADIAGYAGCIEVSEEERENRARKPQGEREPSGGILPALHPTE